jgi:hypothetical protein
MYPNVHARGKATLTLICGWWGCTSPARWCVTNLSRPFWFHSSPATTAVSRTYAKDLHPVLVPGRVHLVLYQHQLPLRAGNASQKIFSRLPSVTVYDRLPYCCWQAWVFSIFPRKYSIASSHFLHPLASRVLSSLARLYMSAPIARSKNIML